MMLKTHLPLFAFVLGLLALAIGCGGGGGGGGNPPPNPTFTPIAVVATLNGKFVDPQNLAPGQTVQLAIVGKNSAGALVVQNGTGWTTNAPASVATVDSSGLATAVAAGNNTYTVTGTSGNKTFTANLGVRNNLATVTGFVRRPNGAAVGFGVIVFYDADSATARIVGRTRVNADGTFRAQVPATAKAFAISLDDLTGYYNQFGYGGGEFTIVTPGCGALLPSLATGQTKTLPNDIVLRVRSSTSPPPPPLGCLPD